MYKTLCILAILPIIALASYPVVSCNNGIGSPVSINIDGCPGPVCEIKRGSNINYNVVFNTRKFIHLQKYLKTLINSKK